MNSISLKLLLLVMASTLAGTALGKSKSEPSCPVPNGVACMSTMEVYRATNGTDKVTSRAQGQIVTAPLPPPAMPVAVVVRTAPQPSGPIAYRPAEYAQLQVQGDSLVISNHASEEPVASVRAAAPRGAEPYRLPAQIMQIFVAPWQDEQGDLHLPERVVTEIEPRHWAMGAPAPDTSTSFRLLELPSEAAKDSQSAVQASTARGQSGNTATPPQPLQPPRS